MYQDMPVILDEMLELSNDMSPHKMQDLYLMRLFIGKSIEFIAPCPADALTLC